MRAAGPPIVSHEEEHMTTARDQARCALRDWPTRVLRGCLWAGLLTYAAAFVLVVIVRQTYRFEIDGEGGRALDALHALRAGRPQYDAPRLDSVALPWAPLYLQLARGLAAVTGNE